MRSYSISDKGRKREENQDRYSNFFHDNFSLLILADGMGGHRDGALASAIAVEKARDYIIENQDREDYEGLLIDAVKTANKEVYLAGRNQDRFRRMGTTICLALVHKYDLYMAHVGDSRIYLYHAGELRQMTRDHSVVSDLLEEGLINKEEALKHPDRHTLTRALGSEEEVEVDIDRADLSEGDIILLCSDGLNNMVSDEEISRVLEEFDSLKDQAEELDRLANEEGGLDNITISLYRIGAEDGKDGA